MKKLILMIMLVFVTMFSFSFSAYGAGQNNKDYTLTSFENKEDLHRIMLGQSAVL